MWISDVKADHGSHHQGVSVTWMQVAGTVRSLLDYKLKSVGSLLVRFVVIEQPMLAGLHVLSLINETIEQ
jgi:hypothetical protein